MLIKAQKEITAISDDETVNMQNYMESLNYVSNLYLFINKIKSIIPMESVKFLPSFYGKMTCSKYDKESEMKVLRVTSPLFFVDKTAKDIMNKMESICENIELENDTITFILK